MKLIKFVNRFFPKFVSKYFNSLDSKKLYNYLVSNPFFIVSKLDSVVLFNVLINNCILDLSDYGLDIVVSSLKKDVLIDLIIYSDSSSRKVLLKNKILKMNLFDCDVNKLFLYLDDSELQILFDRNYFISFLNKRNIIFLREFLESNTSIKNQLLMDARIMNFFREDYSDIKNFKIINLNYSFGEYLISYCFLTNDITLLPLLCNISSDELILLLRNNIEVISSLTPDRNFLFSLPEVCINELVKNDYFLNLYMDNLDKIVSMVLLGYVFPPFLENNREIINYFASLDLQQYLMCYDILSQNNSNMVLYVDEVRRQNLNSNGFVYEKNLR